MLFWCGQTLLKYLPQDDDVFARIAAATGNCQFMFIGFAESRALTAQFYARLQRAFAARGLEAGRHVLIAGPMSQERFLGSVEAADIVLDSIGWSGGKSTLDMLAVAPVIVTQSGAMMRGRHTAAILTRLGVTDTIAATIDEYVGIAARLAKDPAERTAIRQRIASARANAAGDVTPIRAMEEYLARSTASGLDLLHGSRAAG